MKEDAIIFLCGTGGHKEQTKRLRLILEEKLKSKEILSIGILEKNTNLENMDKSYEILPVRDKNCRYKNLYMFPQSVFSSVIITLKILFKYRVKLMISTGPGIAVIPAIIFKIFKKKIIFIETWSRFEKASSTGKFMYRIADYFIIQNIELKEIYPKAIYGGRL